MPPSFKAHANAHISPEVGGTPAPPHKKAPWGGGQSLYHFDEELGYHANHVSGGAPNVTLSLCSLMQPSHTPPDNKSRRLPDRGTKVTQLDARTQVGGNGLEVDGNGRSTIIEDYFNADPACPGPPRAFTHA